MRKIFPVLLLLLLATGCGKINPAKRSEPVSVNGKVTVAGKEVSGTLNFQPTSDEGSETALPVKNGSFKGSVVPGKYTYYVVARGVPSKYQAGSLERQVDVSGGTLDLKIE